MAKDYNPVIANRVGDYLHDDEWRYGFNEEAGCFHFGLRMRGVLRNIQYVIDIEKDDFIVFTLFPLGVQMGDRKLMDRMKEFFCRANHGIRNGRFEFDCDRGDILYVCYVNCKNTVPSKEVIEDSIQCPASMAKRYSEGIFRMMFNDMSPGAAVDLCENNPMQMPEIEDMEEKAEEKEGEEENTDEDFSSPELLEYLRKMMEETDDREEGSPDT